MKSLLVVIVNYGNEQLEYLKTIVSNYKSFKKYKVKIVVHSNIPLEFPEIDEVKLIDNLKNYQDLPMTCRRTINLNRDNFDLFIYSENDHLINEDSLDAHLEYTEILPPNRISGLIQYETDGGNNYYPAYHDRYDWDFNSVEVYNDKVFAHFRNTHQASFILTREQLNKITSLFDFEGYFGVPSGGYTIKVRTNTDVYDCGIFKKMICISELERNLTHHLPNIYIRGEKNRVKLAISDDKKMKNSIFKLLNKNLENILTNTTIKKNERITINKIYYR